MSSNHTPSLHPGVNLGENVINEEEYANKWQKENDLLVALTILLHSACIM